MVKWNNLELMAEPSKSGTVYIGKSRSKSSGLNQKGFFVKKSENKGIDNLIKKANLIIFKTNSVFPILNSLKSKIAITLNRVTITYNGFLTRSEYPMPIENVTGARISQDFLFATLFIDTFGIEKPDPLRYLKITDARLARRYILALIECKKANIDLPLDDIRKLRETLKNIGMVRLSATDAQSDYHKI